MKEFLTKNFSVLLIAALVIFLWGKGSFDRFIPQAPKRDTVIQYIVGQAPVQRSQPPIINVIPSNSIPKPDTSYMGVVRQYLQVVTAYMSTSVYKQTLSLKDSTGREFAQVPITDSVSQNKISRSWSYSFSIPREVVTITQQAPQRRIFYAGGSITTPVTGLLGIQEFSLGILYKDRRDRILGLSGTINFPLHSPGAKLSYYLPLSFKK